MLKPRLAHCQPSPMYHDPDIPRVARLGACPLCGCTACAPRFTAPDFLHGVPGEYTYVTCQDCRTIYQDPQVIAADLSLCYPGTYFTHSAAPELIGPVPVRGGWRSVLRHAILAHADGAEPRNESTSIAIIGRLLARIGPVRRRARFGLIDPLGRKKGESHCLDLGAGNGMMLRYFSKLGWTAAGVEIDPLAAKQASDVSGCEVRTGSLADAGFPPGAFHMIHMSHVLEHLSNLRSTLQLCFDLLQPNGRIVIIYPNPDGLLPRTIGKFAVTWDPPRHLVVPPADSLTSTLSQIGFTNLHRETSARCAAAYRAISRQYRRGTVGVGFQTAPDVGDRLFKGLESVAVAAGFGIGEELIVCGSKP